MNFGNSTVHNITCLVISNITIVVVGFHGLLDGPFKIGYRKLTVAYLY